MSSGSPSPIKQRGGDATARSAFMDTSIGAQKPFLGKTVTNFASVRYGDNGGLNPVSPIKRGLPLTAVTDTVVMRDSNEPRNLSTLRNAKPTMDLDVSERTVSVF